MKRNKFVIYSMIITSMIANLITANKVLASSPKIDVSMNGDFLSLNQEPLLLNGRVFLPIRDISEILSAKVTWNQKAKTVTIDKDNSIILLTIGESSGKINQNSLNLDSPPFIKNNKTMVPLRFVGEALNLEVKWDNANKSVSLSHIESYYIVSSGDTLWSIANKFGISVTKLKGINKLQNDNLTVGQRLTISSNTDNTIPVPNPSSEYHVVQSGDTLWSVSTKYNIPVENIRNYNNLISDSLHVGQILYLEDKPANNQNYIIHKVASGDSIWNLSLKYGITQNDILTANNLSSNTILYIGQELKIPVYDIPVTDKPSMKYGEYLDWWTQAQYLVPVGKTFKVIDFETGKSLNIKRTTGAYHADCEPLTSEDTKAGLSIFGEFTWSPRAVIIEVDGRRVAASMTFMPHDVQNIIDNDFDGHFDIHFKNSTRHKDGLIDYYHQEKVKIAAGIY